MKKINKAAFLRMIVVALSFWTLSGFFPGAGFAAPADFPQKEITIIVNFGPGGGRDILARGVGNTMSKYLGVPVVVMNVPGAGGARGLINLYHSAPDGYTIGIGMVTDILDQIFQKREYDNRKFSFIGIAESSPALLFVKSDSPFHSVKDFKTFGKPIRHSTFSMTSLQTVAAMIIANREGFPLVIVGGYKSARDALLALVRGEVEFAGAVQSVAKPFLQSGQIRPFLTIYQKRSPDCPDIPTVGEIGHPDLEIFGLNFWFMAPPGVEKARIQILENALEKTLKDPKFEEWAKGAGVNSSFLSGEETRKMVFKSFALVEQYKGDIEKYMKEGK
jgi:tripartite-type tricarboxylate transporter receptor subunit TctC